MNVAHRIIVMSGGRVRDEIPQPAFDERRILDAAFAAHIRERDHGEAIRGWPEKSRPILLRQRGRHAA